jgi:hypothetical protein
MAVDASEPNRHSTPFAYYHDHQPQIDCELAAEFAEHQAARRNVPKFPNSRLPPRSKWSIKNPPPCSADIPVCKSHKTRSAKLPTLSKFNSPPIHSTHPVSRCLSTRHNNPNLKNSQKHAIIFEQIRNHSAQNWINGQENEFLPRPVTLTSISFDEVADLPIHLPPAIRRESLPLSRLPRDLPAQ